MIQLIQKQKNPLFFDYQVERLFPDESKQQINVQLARFVKSEVLIRLKRGLYVYSHSQIDEFVLANFVYRPSYVSLESALNYYGIFPDVTGNVTNISPVTTKTIKTSRGIFMYSKIANNLYFGFNPIKDAGSQYFYLIADAEKAILDYIYVRNMRNLTEQRLDLGILDRIKLARYGREFPKWVLGAINEQYRR